VIIIADLSIQRTSSMRKFWFTIAAAAALAALCQTPAKAQGLPSYLDLATYDGRTGNLTLPFVQLGGTLYTNVVVRLDSFAVLSVGSGVSPTCVDTDLTGVKYDAIAIGMTVDRVNQLLGCAYSPQLTNTTAYAAYGSTEFSWASPGGRQIDVWFNNVSGQAAQWSSNVTFKDHYPYYGF
jgi:hypothetical protein